MQMYAKSKALAILYIFFIIKPAHTHTQLSVQIDFYILNIF